MKLLQLCLVAALLGVLAAKFQTKKGKGKAHGKHRSKKGKGKARDDEATLTHLKAEFVFNVTDNLVIEEAEVASAVATPEAVETELNYKVNLSEEEAQDTNFNGQYDKRDENFSCQEDHMGGQLFMVDKVIPKDTDSSLKASLASGSFNKAIGAFVLNKVSVNMNAQKLSVADANKELREIIKLDTVYPRMNDIKAVLDNESDQAKRTSLEKLKIRVNNGTTLMQTLDDKYSSFFCFSMVNEKLSSEDLKGDYNLLRDDKESQTEEERVAASTKAFKAIFQTLNMRDKVNNVHDHSYFQVLTLCHPDEKYIKKWVAFVNREKLDCILEFNKNNLGLVDTKDTVINSGASQGSLEQLAIKAQQDQENRERLRKQEEEERKNSQLTQAQLDQKELERLTGELSDLNDGMNQEQQFSQKDISERLSQISESQNQVSEKGQQLECLEKALQIRGEEENTAVIKLLKDEEMSKVKNVISKAKSDMKVAYEARIEKLKAELKKQKDAIDQQKGGYDDLMVNLIKGGLKKGDKQKCIAPQATVVNDLGKVIPEKLEAFITNACADLTDQQAYAADASNGLLDQINKCTRKELFCMSCCGQQFGSDELLLRQDCQNDCQPVIDLALLDKSSYTAGLTNIIDPVQQKIFQGQIDKEIASKTALASRFKQVFRNHFNKNKHHRR